MSHLEKRRPGLLENAGQLPRVGDGGKAAAAAGAKDIGESWGSDEIKESSLPRVCIPKLAHLGCGIESMSAEIFRPSTPVVPVRGSSADVYALKAASSPQPATVQSQVDLYALLYTSGEALGRVAMRAVSALRRGGVRILSLFEVLVFTYYWHHGVSDDRLGLPVLGVDGWALRLPSPPDNDASPAGNGEGGLVGTAVQRAQAQAHGEEVDESIAPVSNVEATECLLREEVVESLTPVDNAETAECLRDGVDESMRPVSNAEAGECLREGVDERMAPVSNAEAAKFLREVLVVAVGASKGKVPCLPQLSRDLVMDEKTSSPFITVIEGLRAYAQVSVFRAPRKERREEMLTGHYGSLSMTCWPGNPGTV